MGVTVRQKAKGKGKPWWVFINQDGKMRSKMIGDRRAAESVASELRRRLKAGEWNVPPQDTPKVPTFGEYAQKHVEGYAKTACKYTTYRGYLGVLNTHLLPVWENRRLDQITRADVKTLLLSKMRDGKAAGTVANMRTLISGVFTHACDEGVVTVNPALRLGRLLPKQDLRRHIKPLTREQTSVFLATVREHAPKHYPLFLCAFRTGMRMGEVLGLAWGDVDFDAKTITIQRGCTACHFSTPKSHKLRVIDMSEQLSRVLLKHRKRILRKHRGHLPTCEVPDMRGGKKTIQLMFPGRFGGPIDGDNFRKQVFEPLVDKSKLPRFRFHDIRHTFASLLLAQGESVTYVKEQMGHSSIQTTVDVYGHLVPGSNRIAVNRLDDPADEPIEGAEPSLVKQPALAIAS
jgi:integrase